MFLKWKIHLLSALVHTSLPFPSWAHITPSLLTTQEKTVLSQRDGEWTEKDNFELKIAFKGDYIMFVSEPKNKCCTAKNGMSTLLLSYAETDRVRVCVIVIVVIISSLYSY